MITFESDRLTFRFPEVHSGARCSMELQRTLRIPDDDRAYPLPAGLGRFPLRHIDDFADRLPEETVRRGGVVMPMHQAEAMWINFRAAMRFSYPCAVRVATGGVCAVSGDPWAEHLTSDPQNYVVLPGQPWLDGYCVGKGLIRQFVAMPLGGGHTAEEQLTDTAQLGGLQVSVCPLKREVYEEVFGCSPPVIVRCEDHRIGYGMGLGPGGRMRQEIYSDGFGLDAWDQRHRSRCFITIATSAQWLATTGELPPTTLPTAKQYTDAGLPWFDYYDGDREAIAGSETLSGLTSVAQVGRNKGDSPLAESGSRHPRVVVVLSPAGGRTVREHPPNGNRCT